jgi:hypothetical protein
VGAALAGAAVLTVSIGLATVAFASAGSGPITGSVIATGSMPTGMGLAVHPGTNTIVGQYTFGPHSSTGWHSHPGKTLVVVQSGTFTVYHDDCHASIDRTLALICRASPQSADPSPAKTWRDGHIPTDLCDLRLHLHEVALRSVRNR